MKKSWSTQWHARSSQQVENLRLLADASRARAEAEDVTRRMTREGWRSFTDEQEDTSLSFSYDSNQVVPTQASDLPQNVNLSQPLTVNGETIGELSVMGGQNLSPEAASLAASVAAQVSIQIETLRLTEELRKRAAELQELDRLKSAFLANMSHELRTPLNSILGFADVILEGLDGPLTDNMSNDLQLIQKNGRHLLHLINDVLDMAKITAGRMNLNPERFKVHEIFEEVMNITSPLANEKSLSLSIDKGSDEKAEVFADRTRISQVMINVVNNAMKFTEKGKVRLHVKSQGENHSDSGTGYRRGHSARQAGSGLPGIYPGGYFLHSQSRRHGPGPAHQPQVGRDAWRPHVGRKHRHPWRGHLPLRGIAGRSQDYRAGRETGKIKWPGRNYLECVLCGNQQPYQPLAAAVCGQCGSHWLEGRYDYTGFKREILRGLPGRSSTLARFHEILPLDNPLTLDLYPAGGTPLWLSQRFAPALGLGSVYFKDERYGPTSSFKGPPGRRGSGCHGGGRRTRGRHCLHR